MNYTAHNQLKLQYSMAEKTNMIRAQRLKRRSEEEQYHREYQVLDSDDSPKGRKLRKLPSLENLERSSRKSTSPSNMTSTPRLKAIGDRLVLLGRRKSESHSNCDLESVQLSPDNRGNILGIYESRKTIECKFKCPMCYKQFRYLSNLKSHISVVHKMVYKDPKTSPVLTSSNGQNKQKSYECHLCFKKFKYLGNLKTHRKVHSSLN